MDNNITNGTGPLPKYESCVQMSGIWLCKECSVRQKLRTWLFSFLESLRAGMLLKDIILFFAMLVAGFWLLNRRLDSTDNIDRPIHAHTADPHHYTQTHPRKSTCPMIWTVLRPPIRARTRIIYYV